MQYQNISDQGGYGQYNPYAASQPPPYPQYTQAPYGQASAMEQGNGGYGKPHAFRARNHSDLSKKWPRWADSPNRPDRRGS